MTDALATISSGKLTAGITPAGAELQHLTTSDGRELLWGGDPSYWTGRAPVLFPVIGMLAGGGYRLDGKSYAMPKHGFARHSTFDIAQRAANAVTLRLSASDATRALYPFEFQLDIRFSLAGSTLTVAALIANAGDASMPASFGFHPALRWPLPYGEPRSEHWLRFAADEPAPVRRIDHAGLLLPGAEQTPVVGNSLLLRDELFIADALIFDRLASRRVTYGAQRSPKIEIDFADFPMLGVWTKPGAEFICIEPWQGLSDPVGFVDDIRKKPGIIEIAPGASKQFAMQISLLD